MVEIYILEVSENARHDFHQVKNLTPFFSQKDFDVETPEEITRKVIELMDSDIVSHEVKTCLQRIAENSYTMMPNVAPKPTNLLPALTVEKTG